MHKKSKEVKDAATKVIMDELIAIEVSQMKNECMYFMENISFPEKISSL